jgi:hypothetical protein
MNKYKQNLEVIDNKVLSYGTEVARIEGRELVVLGWWSQTTSNHINYIAKEYGLTKREATEEEKNGTKKEAKEEKKDESKGLFNSLAMVAKMGEMLCEDKKEKNDWKLKMFRAGLEGRGLSVPDDWETLSEDEKEIRLNKIIEIAKEV